MNILVFYLEVSYNFFNLIVLILCDKNNIPMEIINNNNSNQPKKTEKNDIYTQKYKNMKSNEIMRVKTKESYCSNYLEEYKKNKKNNNTLRQSKGKIGQK